MVKQQPRSSRKRKLAAIGAVFPLIRLASSSRIPQFPVGQAQRNVQYRHLTEGSSRGPPGHEFVNGFPMGKRRLEKQQSLRLRLDSPEDATNDLTVSHDQSTGERYLSLFVQDNDRVAQRASDSQESEEDQRERSLFYKYDGANNTVEKYNVTADVQFNQSTPDELGFNSTNGTDSESVVLTSSQQLNNVTYRSPYQPLRLRAVLSEKRNGGDGVTSEQRERLMLDIIRPALLSWSAALRVDPVVGNLTVDVHQLYDGFTCGPGVQSGHPTVPVPSFHMAEGIPDTDMILYLSLGFLGTPAPIVFNETETTAPTAPFVEMSNEDGNETGFNNLSEFSPRNATAVSLGNLTALENNTGWNATPAPEAPNVTREEPSLPPPTCFGEYLAAASFCSTDQYDRPTAGMLHICIDDSFFLEENRKRNIVTVMHEIGHVLGFNSWSMAHFRYTDGSPKTPRIDGKINVTEVECTGPQSGRRWANVSLPSEEILKFRTVRGGIRVAEIVTPSVVQVVRNHFDCQTLTGAELESGEFEPIVHHPDEQSCIGNHWERRLFRNDIMNPIVDDVEFSPFVSTMTLAYFADSGWYQVDLSMAQFASSWGRGAGCSFVEETCIGADGAVPPSNEPFFCNSNPRLNSQGVGKSIQGCTADMTRKATCSLGQYDLDLPPEYQYFGHIYGARVGGNDPFIDYCPTYTGFTNGLCQSSENEAAIKVAPIERFGQKNSRCVAGIVNTEQTALCLPIACVVEDSSLRIKVDGKWRICSGKDQRIDVRSGESVVCPDPRRVCPTFYCNRDCLGTSGICDYGSGKCMCAEANSTRNEDGVVALHSCAMTKDESAELPETSTFSISSTYVVENYDDRKFFFGESPLDSRIPHSESPLSDYYVPDEASLKDDKNFLLDPWVTALISSVGFIVFSMISWKGWKWSQRWGEERSLNPNKDKMVASIVVDLRMNHGTGDDLNDTFAATEAETNSSCVAFSDRVSIDSRSDNSFHGLGDDLMVADEPLVEEPPQFRMRRRATTNNPFVVL